MPEPLQGAAPQVCSARIIDDDELEEMLEAQHLIHNHMTRDIKGPGICPACDRHHQEEL